jgi:hypothetical protein
MTVKLSYVEYLVKQSLFIAYYFIAGIVSLQDKQLGISSFLGEISRSSDIFIFFNNTSAIHRKCRAIKPVVRNKY